MSAIRKILVAHDFSPHAREAMRYAIGLAKAFGAEVHLVHAVSQHVEMLSPYEMHLPGAVVADLEDAARSKLDVVVGQLRTAGLVGGGRLRTGDPARAIAEEAEEIGADLVVLGTRGLTGIRHALFGSVAERTHRITPCPVLSVKAED